MLDILAAHYASETDPRARGNIVKGLALAKNDSEQIRTFLVNAMDDSSREARQFAARGAVKSPAAVALPKLVKLLSDSERAVRFTAAQSIGKFGLPPRSISRRLPPRRRPRRIRR